MNINLMAKNERDKIYHNMDLVISKVIKDILKLKNDKIIINNFSIDDAEEKCMFHILLITRMISGKELKIKDNPLKVWKINKRYGKNFDKIKRAKRKEKANLDLKLLLKNSNKYLDDNFTYEDIYNEYYNIN